MPQDWTNGVPGITLFNEQEYQQSEVQKQSVEQHPTIVKKEKVKKKKARVVRTGDLSMYYEEEEEGQDTKVSHFWLDRWNCKVEMKDEYTYVYPMRKNRFKWDKGMAGSCAKHASCPECDAGSWWSMDPDARKGIRLFTWEE
jgi:hypothetical protein